MHRSSSRAEVASRALFAASGRVWSIGYIETPMFHDAIPADEHDAVIAAVVATRLGTAEDVANAVAFIASTEASYINGQDLIIDGGLVAAIPA